MDPLAKTLWESGRRLVVEQDGLSTSLFVVGLTTPQPTHSREQLEAWLSDIEATSASVSWEASEVQHIATLQLPDGPDLQIYLEPREAGTLWDAEVVFWSDTHFPADLAEQEKISRFERLVRLGERLRSGSPLATCVITPEFNGNPQELLTRRGVLRW